MKLNIQAYEVKKIRHWLIGQGSEKRRSRGGGQLTLNTMPQIEGGGASAVCGESATATTTEATRG
jgi:hypothetical protein